MIAAAQSYGGLASVTCPHSGMVHIHPQLLTMLVDQLTAAQAEIKATREFVTNKNVDPPDKIISLCGLYSVGAAPGRPGVDRSTEYSTVTRARIATAAGMKTTQGGTRLKRICDLKLLDRTVERQKDERGQWTTTVRLKPPEGKDWAETWANPRQINLKDAAPPKAFDEDNKRQGDKRKETKAVLDEARKILAECPSCHSQDVDLRCHTCGVITPLADVLDTSRAANGDHAPHHRLVSLPLRGAPAATAIGDLDGLVRLDHVIGDEPSVPPPSSWDDRDTESVLRSPGDESQPTCDAPDHRNTESVPPLEAAVTVLAPVLIHGFSYVQMMPRRADGDTKYVTRHEPLTETVIADHLQGRLTIGNSIFWPDPLTREGRLARAVAWDADEKDDGLRPLLRGAARLKRAGLEPLVVRNKTKNSGHLWLIFDRPVDPARALAAAEHRAPDLATLREHFPNPKASDGGRLRAPGGQYLPVGKPAVPVQVAIAAEWGMPDWQDGTTSAGWAVIAAAVSRADILEVTFIPPNKRPQQRAVRPKAEARRLPAAANGEASGNVFADFNRDHPIETLVELVQKGARTFFKAPWRDERTASVILNPDGSWHDFGDNRHGKDAFDLYCAMNKYWDENANKPDRKAAYRALRPQPVRTLPAIPHTHGHLVAPAPSFQSPIQGTDSVPPDRRELLIGGTNIGDRPDSDGATESVPWIGATAGVPPGPDDTWHEWTDDELELPLVEYEEFDL